MRTDPGAWIRAGGAEDIDAIRLANMDPGEVRRNPVRVEVDRMVRWNRVAFGYRKISASWFCGGKRVLNCKFFIFFHKWTGHQRRGEPNAPAPGADRGLRRHGGRDGRGGHRMSHDG